MAKNNINIDIPHNFRPFMDILIDREGKKRKPGEMPDYRYLGAYGGRGGGKSVNMCISLISIAMSTPTDILCCREKQVSIEQSVYKLLKSIILENNLPGFNITKTKIQYRHSSGWESNFVFHGLNDQSNSVENIKSFYNFKIFFIEEAHTITESTIEILVPTLRLPGSQVWAAWNPRTESDPIMEKLFQHDGGRIFKMHINIDDLPAKFRNKELLDEMAFEWQLVEQKKMQRAMWDHKWKGVPLREYQKNIFNPDMVDFCVENKKASMEGPVEGGCDYADTGGDYIVHTTRKGCVVTSMEYYQYIESNEYIEIFAKDFAPIKNSVIKFDSTGAGMGIPALLRPAGWKIDGVNFGQRPRVSADEEHIQEAIKWAYASELGTRIFVNARDEMVFELADLINSGRVSIPNIKKLKEQLKEIQWITKDIKGYTVRSVESTESFKKRCGKSPDFLFSLALAFYKSRGQS